MIKPTVGRVVWLREIGLGDEVQPLAATVVYVHSDTMVNLAAFTENGRTFELTSVPLVQEGGADKPHGGYYCEWMPYQKGQAAKTEASETGVKGAVLTLCDALVNHGVDTAAVRALLA